MEHYFKTGEYQQAKIYRVGYAFCKDVPVMYWDNAIAYAIDLISEAIAKNEYHPIVYLYADNGYTLTLSHKKTLRDEYNQFGGCSILAFLA